MAIGLKRSLSLPLITCYGLGTILGAGIYVLVGKVAIYSEQYIAFSFLLAAIIATFTALSYAELSSRFPKSGSESVYALNAFHRHLISQLVGYAVIFTGIISAAVMAKGLVGYLHVFFDVPGWVIICVTIFLLCLLASWGIVESISVAAVITVIEVLGLLFILYISRHKIFLLQAHWQHFLIPDSAKAWSGIMLGGFLAFYAYIGFEDMVKVAEEVKNPKRNLPRSIIWVLVLTTLLYVLVSLAVVLSLSPQQLKSSDAPLAAVAMQAGYAPAMISIISILAILNGLLAQIIMASRMFYGMAKQHDAPRVFGKISPLTQTPLVATIVVGFVILFFSILLPLVTLAELTSFIILLVFAMVNISLIVIKLKKSVEANGVVYPLWVPTVGAVLCVFLLVTRAFYLLW